MASQENERFTEEQHSIKRLIQKEGSKLSQCFSQNENVAFFTTKYKQKALNFVVKCNFLCFLIGQCHCFYIKNYENHPFLIASKQPFHRDYIIVFITVIIFFYTSCPGWSHLNIGMNFNQCFYKALPVGSSKNAKQMYI